MFRVLALQIRLHRLVGVGPEAREVAGDLHRAAGGGQKVQQQRNPAAGDARGLGKAEHLLQAHRQNRLLAVIVDGDAGAARHLDMGRGLGVQAGPQLPGQKGAQGARQVDALQMGAARHAVEEGGQPLLQTVHQGRVGQVGPVVGVALPRAQEHHAGAPFAKLVGPGQAGGAERADALDHRGGHRVRRRLGQLLVLQDQGEQHAAAPGQHHLLARVPGDDGLAADVVGEALLQIGQRHRGGQEDARFAGGAVEVGDGEPLLGRQRLGLLEIGAAPARQAILRRHPAGLAAGAALADAVGIGQRHQNADGVRVHRVVVAHAKLAAPLPGLLHRLLGAAAVDAEAARSTLAAALLTAQQVDAQAQVGVAETGLGADDVALAQQGRDQTGERALAHRLAGQHHVGQTRMHAEAGHAAAVRGDGARLLIGLV